MGASMYMYNRIPTHKMEIVIFTEFYLYFCHSFFSVSILPVVRLCFSISFSLLLSRSLSFDHWVSFLFRACSFGRSLACFLVHPLTHSFHRFFCTFRCVFILMYEKCVWVFIKYPWWWCTESEYFFVYRFIFIPS